MTQTASVRRLPRRAALIAAALCAGELAVPSLLQGQTPMVAPAAEAIVKEIEVRYAGPRTVSRERILANIRTAVGQPFNYDQINSDVQNLYASGTVANIRVQTEDVSGGVKVILVVETRTAIGEVVITGASRIKESRLRKEITAKPGLPAQETLLAADREKILKLYTDRGLLDTTVSVKTDLLVNGTTRVSYIITESGKIFLHDIRFEHNSVFTEKILRKQMKLRPRGILAFLGDNGKYDATQLDEDLLKITQYYQDAGYIDVKIGEVRQEPLAKGGIDLVIPIYEGSTYVINNLSFTGLKLVKEEDVRSLFKTKGGETYKAKDLRDDIKIVSDYYGTRGYVDFNLVPNLLPAGPGRLNIVLAAEEGLQSYVGLVNIDGNTKTQDKVVRRELAVAPGAIYNTVRVDASKKRLENLGYFEKVDIYPTSTANVGVKNLNVLVTEKQTGSVQFGAGFSSVDSIVGFAEVTQGNFDLFNFPAFTGAGQKFRARLQYGTQRNDFVMSLTEPYFMDSRLSLGGEVFYRDASYVSSVYSQRTYGGNISIRREINNFAYFRLQYGLQTYDIYNVDSDASQSIQDEAGKTSRSQVSGSLVYDTRDDFFLTRKGQKVTLTASYGGGPLGGDVNTYGLGIEGSKFFLLPADIILQINGEVSVVDSHSGKDGSVPIYERLFLGGANDLRGFDYRDVGPKDVNNEAIGGRTLARFTSELTFPVTERVRGAVFFDTGFVNAKAYDFTTADYNADIGIGVRLDLPIGPIRIDYGIPVVADQFNSGGGKFNFNVGYQF